MGVSTAGPAIGSSISPSMEGPSMGDSVARQSISSIRSMPELRVSASNFSMDTNIQLGENATITQIKRPDGVATRRTEIPQVFRDAFNGPVILTSPEAPAISQPANRTAVKTEAIRITLPDLTTKPYQIKTEDLIAKPEPFAHPYPVMELNPEPDIKTTPLTIDAREPETKSAQTIPISPFANMEPSMQAKPALQPEGITAQEAKADEKLARALMAQIEGNPKLDPRIQIKLIQEVEQIVTAKIQPQDVLQPPEVVQKQIVDVKTQIAEVEYRMQKQQQPQTWWETYQVNILETVDEEGDTVKTKTKMEYTGKKPKKDLEKPAQNLADQGVTRMIKINGNYLEGDIDTHLKDLDLQRSNQKAA